MGHGSAPKDPNYKPEGTWTPIPKGYAQLPLLNYMINAGIVSGPLYYFIATGRDEWVWRYLLLITLSLLIYYRASVSRFQNFVSKRKL